MTQKDRDKKVKESLVYALLTFLDAGLVFMMSICFAVTLSHFLYEPDKKNIAFFAALTSGFLTIVLIIRTYKGYKKCIEVDKLLEGDD